MNAETHRCWAVVPAAGIGARMGGTVPKQYLELAGATLLEHSVGALLTAPQIRGVIVALHPQDDRAATLAVLADDRVHRVDGAQERSGSVLAGLEALVELATEEDWVLVHDAARPCLGSGDLQRLIEAVTGSGTGGLLAEPIVDTVKETGEGGLVQRTLDRDKLWRAQTPQMFRLGELRRALVDALGRAHPVTDEASAMELAGHPVQLVAATGGNLKVTVPADLPLARWYLENRGTDDR